MTPEDLEERALALHGAGPGKLEVRATVPLETSDDLALAYTPGVAAVCRAIAADPAAAYRYTVKGNTVAIVTDGTAVLGLGDIGPLAALPVMEGKAALFKTFAGIDAFPLCFAGHEADFADRVRSITPAFGGINLEDIAAPRCFEIEEALQDCGIPVMHDDQHGTAIVVLAALLNACRAIGRRFEDQTIANRRGRSGRVRLRPSPQVHRVPGGYAAPSARSSSATAWGSSTTAGTGSTRTSTSTSSLPRRTVRSGPGQSPTRSAAPTS